MPRSQEVEFCAHNYDDDILGRRTCKIKCIIRKMLSLYL